MLNRRLSASVLVRAGALAALIAAVSTAPAPAQRDFSDVEIKTTKLADGIYMLEGSGGNMGLSVGDDGAFLIDDQFAPLTEKIKKAIAAVTDKQIRFVVNTHWHGDHTGGNENMGDAGAILVAHENVRKRMSVEHFNHIWDRTTPPSPDSALPVVTFTTSVTFHWNGEEMHVFHVSDAHTDGDGIIHFKKANVVHMGDTLFNRQYPFIDTSSGGSIHGVIEAANRVLAIADEGTKIIAGHGPLANRKDVEEYRDMLVAIRAKVKALVDQGKSLDESVAAKPTAAFDEKWGGGWIKPDVMARLVYESLAGK
jgi:glyoxylase-like metal-dependent hydrolase (beta-lactamase superfamily II)